MSNLLPFSCAGKAPERTCPEIVGTRVLMLGYGREGRSVLAFLRQQRPELELCVADARAIEADLPPGVSQITGPDYLECVPKFETAILSPGIPLAPALLERWQKTTWLTSATNLFLAQAPGTVIGVTGTKGKSTTSSLIAALLKSTHQDVRLVGNIGIPALEFLAGANANTFFVQELSSYQLEFCRYSPQIAVLLRIVPEHLDRHGSFEAYARAKANITVQQDSRAQLVCSADFPELEQYLPASRAMRHRYSRMQKHGVDFFERDQHLWVARKGESKAFFELSQSALRGPGNIENMLAACTAAALCGVETARMAKVLAEFTPLEHRLQLVAQVGGVRYVNDSLSTIPEALQQALQAYAGEIGSVIAGGFDRGVSYELAAQAILEQQVPVVILLPTTGARIAQALFEQQAQRLAQEAGAREHGLSFPQVLQVATLEEAVRLAKQRTASGKVCLFSPAASSYNQFRDYRERGERFCALVRGN